jgi:hypothetical protein
MQKLNGNTKACVRHVKSKGRGCGGVEGVTADLVTSLRWCTVARQLNTPAVHCDICTILLHHPSDALVVHVNVER